MSLELAANGTPMVIAYDVAPLTRFLAQRLIKLDTVTLVNLVSETRAIPEFLGRDCQPDRIAAALKTLLNDAGARSAQFDAMGLTMARLGRGHPAGVARGAIRAGFHGFASG